MDGNKQRPTIKHWRDWLNDVPTDSEPASDEATLDDLLEGQDSDEPQEAQEAPPKKKKRGAVLAGVLGIAVLLAAGAGTAKYFYDQKTTPAPAAVPSSAAPTVEEWCAALGGERGEGDPTTPEGALVAMEHDYYVDRDADKVASHYSPNAALDREALAEALSQIPDSSRHCVVTTPVESPLVNLDAYVLDKDGTQRVYKLKAVMTQNDEGNWVVQEMSQRKEETV